MTSKESGAQDPIVISMATVPRRLNSLRHVVGRLLPQCNRLNVYLNGHASVPSFLKHGKVQVALSHTHGDRGDAGKFWWCEDLGDAYHLTVDDDIAYPRDYCRRLVATVEELKRGALVGVHGVMLPKTVQDTYYNDRRVYSCFKGMGRSRAVHVLGTGTLAYHTSTIRLRRSDFRRPNMADIWLALVARREHVPLICIRRDHQWLADLGDPRPALTIAATQSRHDRIQAAALRTQNPWRDPLTMNEVPPGSRDEGPPEPRIGIRRSDRANAHSGREFGAKKTDGSSTGVSCGRSTGGRIKR